MCEMNDVLEHTERFECMTCGHEWAKEAAAEAPDAERVVKDAYGNVLVDGSFEQIRLRQLERGG
jgi:protein PhnA